MPHNFYAIIPHPNNPQILLLPTENGWTIPLYLLESSWTPYVAYIDDAVHDALHFNAVVRYTPHVQIEKIDDKRQVSAVYVLIPPPDDWTLPDDATWATLDQYRALPIADEWQKPHVEAYFAEEQSGSIPDLRPPWGRKGWYNTLVAWVEAQLAEQNTQLTGPLKQLKQWDISSVLKASTDRGDIFVKAIPALFAAEPRITLGLSTYFPGVVPTPIATYETPTEGRLIMRDFGGTLLWTPDTDPALMEEALRIFARMQITFVDRHDDLRAIGCGDRRIEHIATQLREILADQNIQDRLEIEEIARLNAIIPNVEQAVDRLLAMPIPQTLLHGDFHTGNIATTPTGIVIFDWTDACICHPFFDLTTVLENDYEPITPELRETYLTAYLDEWQAAGYGTTETLRETADLALKLAPLYHAVSYWQIGKIAGQAMKAELGGAFPEFLRMILNRLETP